MVLARETPPSGDQPGKLDLMVAKAATHAAQIDERVSEAMLKVIRGQ